MSMTIKMLSEVLRDHQLQAKFIVLQLVLLLAKFQALTARIIVRFDLIACEPPITPAVYANCKLHKMMPQEYPCNIVLGYLYFLSI